MNDIHPTKVWVVMCNDYPESVWFDGEAAKAYVKELMDTQRAGMKPYESPTYYWRAYEKPVKG